MPKKEDLGMIFFNFTKDKLGKFCMQKLHKIVLTRILIYILDDYNLLYLVFNWCNFTHFFIFSRPHPHPQRQLPARPPIRTCLNVASVGGASLRTELTNILKFVPRLKPKTRRGRCVSTTFYFFLIESNPRSQISGKQSLLIMLFINTW